MPIIGDGGSGGRGTLPPVLSFGRGGNGVAHLRQGWSQPEDGFTWSTGHESALEIPFAADDRGFYVEFRFGTFTCAPNVLRQRLAIAIDGSEVFAGAAESDIPLGIILPASSSAKRQIRLRLPDAASPHSLGLGGDDRKLGISLREISCHHLPQRPPFSPIFRNALPMARLEDGNELARAVTGLGLRELSLAFESFGLNCEFGIFQRRCDAEPLSLMRFAGIDYAGLLQGLPDAFTALDDPALLTAETQEDGKDWIVRHRKYGFFFHTLRLPSEIGAEALLAEQARALAFRRKRFAEILAGGKKLFVINRPEGMTAAEALPLLMRLRRAGPNALLYISDRTGKPPGSVEALAPDLFRGAMDGINRIGDEDELVGRENWLSDAGMAAWISICANAYRLWRENRGW